MRLDVPTLTAVIFLNALAMAVALTAVSDFKSRPGTRFWVWGAWSQAVGWGVLIAGYRSGTFLLLSMAAVCFSASFSLAHRSVLSFLGHDTPQPWLWVAPLGVAVLHPAAHFMLDSPHLRIAVVALASLLQSVALVLSLVRAPADSAAGWRWFLVVMMSASAGFALLKLGALAITRDPSLASGEGMNILGLLIASVTLNLNSLALLLAQRTHAQRKLEVMATTDALTGLANRGSLISAGERAFAEAAQTGAPLTVVMIDLDCFKAVNDTYGHLLGDEVLARMAALLRDSVRRPDIVGRFGGEEFCIIMPGSHIEAALAIDRRLRDALAATVFSAPALHPDFSAGATESVPADARLNDVLSRADALLYRAKESGRGRIAVSQAHQGASG